MAKHYMLDTDICSYIIKNFNENVGSKYGAHFDDCCISAITYGELLYWVQKKNSQRLSESVHLLVDQLDIVPLDETAMGHYARIRVELENAGTPTGSMDLLIAAGAMSAGAVLITHNTKHFAKIKGLKVEDWL